MRIFLADDSTPLLKSLESLLSDVEKLEIVGRAQTAQEAMRGVENLKPDLLILDLRIPVEGGLEVLRTIAQSCPATRTIVLTSYAYPQYRRECARLGAEFFFDKATESQELVPLIRRLIEAGPENGPAGARQQGTM